MSEEDFKKKIDEARETARKKADGETQDQLDAIDAQADKLQGIFDGLKLTDRSTYDSLVQVVTKAEANNESVSHVITRLNALGDSGKKLAATIAGVSRRGSIELLTRALGKA